MEDKMFINDLKYRSTGEKRRVRLFLLPIQFTIAKIIKLD